MKRSELRSDCRAHVRRSRNMLVRSNRKVSMVVADVVADNWPTRSQCTDLGDNRNSLRNKLRADAKTELVSMSPMMWWLLWQVAKIVIKRLLDKYWSASHPFPTVYADSEQQGEKCQTSN